MNQEEILDSILKALEEREYFTQVELEKKLHANRNTLAKTIEAGVEEGRLSKITQKRPKSNIITLPDRVNTVHEILFGAPILKARLVAEINKYLSRMLDVYLSPKPEIIDNNWDWQKERFVDGGLMLYQAVKVYERKMNIKFYRPWSDDSVIQKKLEFSDVSKDRIIQHLQEFYWGVIADLELNDIQF